MATRAKGKRAKAERWREDARTLIAERIVSTGMAEYALWVELCSVIPSTPTEGRRGRITS